MVARRVNHIQSVEHDSQWQILGQNLKNAKIKEVKRINSEFNLEDSIINSYKQRIRQVDWPQYTPEKVLRRGLEDEGFESYASF